MTLSPCYRAACDVPGCTTDVYLPHARTAECCAQLIALGWTLLQHRRITSGAPRRLHVCPTHHDWRPPGFNDGVKTAVRRASMRDIRVDAIRRRAVIWLLHGAGVSLSDIAGELGISAGHATELAAGYERRIKYRQQDAQFWQELWARRLRAAGAIP